MELQGKLVLYYLLLCTSNCGETFVCILGPSVSGAAFSFFNVDIDYFIESAPYGFLFTSRKTLENERVSAANE